MFPFVLGAAAGAGGAGGAAALTAAQQAAQAAAAAKLAGAARGAVAGGGGGGAGDMPGYAAERGPNRDPGREGIRRPGFDEGQFLYGGSAERTQGELDRAGRNAAGWDGRGFYFADERDQAAHRDASLRAREDQMYGQHAARAQAMGQGPSVAGAQFAGNLDQTALAQAAGMAGGGSQFGRPGHSSLAAQTAGGQAMGGLAGQYGAGVAGETAAGRGAFIDGAGNMRQGDTRMSGLDAGWQKSRADAFGRQRGLQDEQALFFEKQRYGINQGNMAAVDAVNRANVAEYGRNLRNARKNSEDSANETADTLGMIGTGLQTYANVTAPTPPPR